MESAKALVKVSSSEKVTAKAFFCPQCGASYNTNENEDRIKSANKSGNGSKSRSENDNHSENRDERFSLILAKEFENPDYGAVHHLSVPCYYLQHNLYSKEGWLAVRELVKQFISGKMTPEIARREIRANFDGDNKPFSMTKGEKLTAVTKIKWSMTIADIRLSTAETYCFDVQRWAENIIKDSEQMVGRYVP